LQRALIKTGNIRNIAKEATSMWEQGDDLSAVIDCDETGFSMIGHGKRRKVVLPDPNFDTHNMLRRL